MSTVFNLEIISPSFQSFQVSNPEKIRENILFDDKHDFILLRKHWQWIKRLVDVYLRHGLQKPIYHLHLFQRYGLQQMQLRRQPASMMNYGPTLSRRNSFSSFGFFYCLILRQLILKINLLVFRVEKFYTQISTQATLLRNHLSKFSYVIVALRKFNVHIRMSFFWHFGQFDCSYVILHTSNRVHCM